MGTAGAGRSRKRYRKAVYWKVDLDYLNRLTPEDRAWVEDFCDAFYNVRFAGACANWSKAERRAANRARNAATRDLSSQFEPQAGGKISPGTGPWAAGWDTKAILRDSGVPPGEELDLRPTPEYLSSPEYKAALAKYRETLAETHDRVPTRTPAEQDKHTQARADLVRATEWIWDTDGGSNGEG